MAARTLASQRQPLLTIQHLLHPERIWKAVGLPPPALPFAPGEPSVAPSPPKGSPPPATTSTLLPPRQVHPPSPPSPLLNAVDACGAVTGNGPPRFFPGVLPRCGRRHSRAPTPAKEPSGALTRLQNPPRSPVPRRLSPLGPVAPCPPGLSRTPTPVTAAPLDTSLPLLPGLFRSPSAPTRPRGRERPLLHIQHPDPLRTLMTTPRGGPPPLARTPEAGV